MPSVHKTIFLLSLLLVAFATALGQVPTSQSPDDVVRVTTELVQTRVGVFDKNGKLVTGLKQEDFDFRVDGKRVPISFFENIISGSTRDRSPRSGTVTETRDRTPQPVSQRTIVFFLDDRHLSLDSIGRARKMLLDFIDKDMGSNDLVAIASTSGQVGFLQQFTDNKEVLRAAVGRISHVPYVVTDYAGNPGAPMTEYMALTIERRDDSRVAEFYIQDCLKYAPRGITRQDRASLRRHCEIEVSNRARQILLQAGTATSNTYQSLRTLLETAQKMSGSKLAFFISDGFLADTGPRGGVGHDHLAKLTEEARQAGVVFYTIDARGLISGSLDASGNVAFDDNGLLASARSRELTASQDALNAIAADTGGRALRNQNFFDGFINDALAETSQYYLIAWRPESSDNKNNSRKIEVSVAGRPELSVRMANMFLSKTSDQPTGGAAKTNAPEADLRTALTDAHIRRGLPLQLSLIYFDTPDRGMVLTSSIQAPTEMLSYGTTGNEPADLAVSGVVLTDQGKVADSFSTSLKVNQFSSNQLGSSGSHVIYNYPAALKPGMYQVRVAARDTRSGILGSAAQWVVIPDLAKGELSLSSLIVGLQNLTENNKDINRVQWSVDRQFVRGSTLRFMTFIYNAKQSNLVVRVQVHRNGALILSTPPSRITLAAQGDPRRMPYSGEVRLGELPAGKYDLQLTVSDATGKTASQTVPFYIH